MPASYCIFASGIPTSSIVGLGILISIVVAFVAYCLGRSHGYEHGVSYGRSTERLQLDALHREHAKAKTELLSREAAAERREQEIATLFREKQNLIEQKQIEVDALCEKKLKRAEARENEAAATLRAARQKFEDVYREKEVYLSECEKDIRAIASTCVSSHPDNAYIAEVWNGTVDAVMHDIIDDLEWRAEKTAARMEKKFNQSARQWQFDAKYYKLQTLLYESLFPELVEYSSGFEPDHSPQTLDKSTEKDWLSDEEYANLSSSEKSQLALDRYIASHGKSSWQIGRDYELYIGYCYRRKGFQVEHVGMEKKLSDLGRDLICRSNPLVSRIETHIVQCKYWSTGKLIHEKHVTQLFGTTVEYAFAHGIALVDGRLPPRLKPVLITSTSLSDTARRFADALGVEYHENIPFPRDPNSFPRIKCNKSSGIYHLPFDEQYDVTKVVPSEGDCFAKTVADAEAKGFVRAKRYFTQNTVRA